MDKKSITDKVTEDEDVFDKILFYAEQKSWIYLTHDLVSRLKKKHKNHEYACPRPEGDIFEIRKGEKEWDMHVDRDLVWNKIALLTLTKPKLDWKEQPNYLDYDPEVIVFLS